MPAKADIYHDDRVHPFAKRLAQCFNLSARMKNDGDPLRFAKQLFMSQTGQKEIPFSDKHTEAYLREKLIDMASRTWPAGAHTPQDLEITAQKLVKSALDKGLIRKVKP